MLIHVDLLITACCTFGSLMSARRRKVNCRAIPKSKLLEYLANSWSITLADNVDLMNPYSDKNITSPVKTNEATNFLHLQLWKPHIKLTVTASAPRCHLRSFGWIWIITCTIRRHQGMFPSSRPVFSVPLTLSIVWKVEAFDLFGSLIKPRKENTHAPVVREGII